MRIRQFEVTVNPGEVVKGPYVAENFRSRWRKII